MNCHKCHKSLLLGDKRHIYFCDQSGSTNTVRRSFLTFNSSAPDLLVDAELLRLYETEQRSVADIVKMIGLSPSCTRWLLMDSGCHLRGIKEACGNARTIKIRQTTLERYNVDNASKSPVIQAKKEATFRAHYGVSNVFQSQWFKSVLPGIMLGKYGVRSLPNRYGGMKAWWDSQTKEMRKAHMRPAITAYLRMLSSLTDDERGAFYATTRANKMLQPYSSSLEVRVASVLTSAGIPHITQKWVARRSYDFSILDVGLLIEVNGDFWHANPDIYQADDILPFPGGVVKASDLWARDMVKIATAEKYRYRVLTLWEADMETITDDELLGVIIRAILEVGHGND